jgi:hypothetical protein
MSKDTLKVDGKLLGKSPVEQITDNFRKRQFFIETDSDSQWPQIIEFELFQDKVDKIDEFVIGQHVSVGFNLRGRKYTNKTTKKEGVITTLNAWFIGASKAENTGGAKSVTAPSDANDDLPF